MEAKYFKGALLLALVIVSLSIPLVFIGTFTSTTSASPSPIVRCVDVTVLPRENEGPPCTWVTFDIAVTNWGEATDNYLVEYVPNGWPVENIIIDNNELHGVAPGEERHTTLRVHVPDNLDIAWPCMKKEIVVVATSQENENVSDEDSCLVHVSGFLHLHGENLIDLKNPVCTLWHELYPRYCKSYHLSSWEDNNGDNMLSLGDKIDMEDNWYYVEEVTVTIFVENAVLGSRYLEFEDGFENYDRPIKNPVCTQWHEVWPEFCRRYHLSAWEDTNMDNNLGYCDWVLMMDKETGENYWCHVENVATDIILLRKQCCADVIVLPRYQSGVPCAWLEYDVTVHNCGDFVDNFHLSYIPNGWPGENIWFDDNQLEDIPPCENRTTTLHVHIPENAENCTEKEIIVVAESKTCHGSDNDSCIAHVEAPAPGVSVSISPDYDNGVPCTTLEYTVTVQNTGNIDDNYILSWSDNTGWGDNIWLDDNLLTVPVGQNRTATLYVHVPENVAACTRDNITVTATSQTDNTVSDNDSCIAHVVAVVRGVRVSILPSSRSGAPGENVTFTVTITNTGNVPDNYTLAKQDNRGWTLTLPSSTGSLNAGASVDMTLKVTIPENAENCTRDNIIVTATSRENSAVKDNKSCIAHALVGIVRGVEVSITPDENWAAPGDNVTFTVTITNTGNALDNYTLGKQDNRGWTLTLPSSTGSLSAGASENKILQVTIPENAENCTRDNIIVTAISRADNTVKDNDSCIAHAGPFAPGVQVSISPDYDNDVPCTTLEYTVTVRNTGAVDDNYDLSWSDNAGWGDNIWLEDNLLWVAHGEENSITLYVHMPENVAACTRDNITVTATSQTDNTVSDNDSCIAHVIAVVRGVEVSISPSENEGLPGDEVTFFVVVMNLGNAQDNFDLDVDDNSGWALTLDDDSFEDIPPGEYEDTILRVIIPENATPCTRNSVTVTATSVSDNTVSDSDSCIAHAAERAAPSRWPTIAGTVVGAIAMIGTGVAFYTGGKPFHMRGPAAAGIIGGIVMIGGAIAGSPVIFGIGGALVIIGVVFALYMMRR